MIYINLSEDLKGFSITTKGYDATIVAKIRKIPGRVWNANKLEWTVPMQEQTMQLLHTFFGPEQVHFEDSLRKIEIVRMWFPSDVATAKAIREALLRLSHLMTLKGFSPKTKKAYEGHIRRFCQSHAHVFLKLEVSHVHTVDPKRKRNFQLFYPLMRYYVFSLRYIILNTKRF